MNLCLDGDRITHGLGGFDGPLDRRCELGRRGRDPGVGEDLFGLIFVESHWPNVR